MGTLTFIFILSITSLTLSTNLKSEWGIVYQQKGFIYPNVERHFITIDIEIPKEKNLMHNYEPEITCTANHIVVREVCLHYAETVRTIKRSTHRRTEKVKEKYANIQVLLPKAKAERDKRFVLFPLISLFTGAIGFVSQYHMHRKITALASSVDTLVENNFVMNKKISTIYENQVTIVQKTAQKFDDLGRRLDKQGAIIVNLTRDIEKRLLTIELNFAALSRFQAELTASIDQYSHKVYECYTATEILIDAYYNGILDLMMGRLPRDLIGPSELVAILETANQALRDSLPEYELLHQNLAHYYKKTDLVYDIVQEHLVVTIPILIKKSNQKLMPLFRVETCHVPYQVTEDSKEPHGSFTKIKVEHDYIAILDSNFVEFTHAQMDDCIVHDEIWTCDALLLQTHQSKMSCLAAIYWDYDYEVVKGLCNFEYFHNIQPQPTILESDEQILMANLDIPWSFDCKSRNIPLRIKGSRYAVLTRESICGCSILGSSFYIEEKLCKQKLGEIVLSYPVNAAVMAYHKTVLLENKITNVSTLFPKPPHFIVPMLNITLHNDDDTLVETNEGKPIPLARVSSMLQKQKKIFYDTSVKQIENSKFENWWAGENIAIGCAFVLALMGSILGVVAIFNCVRTHRVSATMGAMLMQQVPKANALPMFCKRDASLIEILPPLLVQLAVSLTLFLTIKLIWKMYTKWSIVKIINPNTVAIKTRNEVHFLLELFNEREYIRLYVFTVHSNPMYLSVFGTIIKMSLTLELRKLYCYLSFDWTNSNMVVKQEGRRLQLPQVAYVPLYNYHKVKRILNNSHGTRLIMNNDGMAYVQSETLTLKTIVDPETIPETG